MFRTGMMTVLVLAGVVRAQEADLATQLRQLDDRALNVGTAQTLKTMLQEDARARIQAANRRETDAWRKIRTRGDWEAYRKDRLAALRRSLGMPDSPAQKSEYHLGRSFEGEGYRLECLVFKSPTGQWVPALLYLPAQKPD